MKVARAEGSRVVVKSGHQAGIGRVPYQASEQADGVDVRGGVGAGLRARLRICDAVEGSEGGGEGARGR